MKIEAGCRFISMNDIGLARNSHRVPVASVASLTFAYTEAVQRAVGYAASLTGARPKIP
jgi:hypothetical protein